jgi:hypothetical protein
MRQSALERRPELLMSARKTTARSGAPSIERDYVRARDLPKLVALWPRELQAASLAERARLLAKLRRALRAERQRGRGGHWTYDLARHAQLLRAYRAEAADYLQAVRTSCRRDRAT